MIPVADATARILAQVVAPTPRETLPLVEALSQVLAEDIRAPLDVPPADNSALDGYAVGGADLASRGAAPLRVVGDLPAGSVYAGTIGPGEALRSVTAAPVPAVAHTAVPHDLAT